MGSISWWKHTTAVFLLCAATAIASRAQTLATLISFNRTDGANPLDESLVQGTDGNFYGTTNRGGVYSTSCNGGDTCGTAFKITSEGKLTTLHRFCTKPGCPDGYYPSGGLVLATDGNFYGMMFTGGTSGGNCGGGCGTIFEITSAGKLTTLHRFDYTDGDHPSGGRLVEAANGEFYGTTVYGGANKQGTVFEVTATGALKTLYSFCAQPNCTDGEQPQGGLVQATDGNFYGTTTFGGTKNSYCPYGCGTFFRINAQGTLTTLYSFCAQGDCTDGSDPAGLIQGDDGNFYGIAGGGTYDSGVVFEITAGGALTTLHSFCSQVNNEGYCTDGLGPVPNLVQATDGNIYGATQAGGANNDGTVFKMSIRPAGTLATLYNFCAQPSCTDGRLPAGGLLQSTNGNFYGTTYWGGKIVNPACAVYPPYHGCGIVFSLDMGLGPFVAFVRGYGKVGQTVSILGQRLTGTTGVSFNGIPADYKVVSDTFIRTKVPLGAKTGYVTVTTPGGKLTSNQRFRVIP